MKWMTEQQYINRMDKINRTIQISVLIQFVFIVILIATTNVINFKIACISGGIASLGFLIARD
jgi:hypothetical protein